MFSNAELRKSTRYAVRLPVTVKVGNTQRSARSVNISQTGILLLSDFSPLEGSSVELTVHLTRPIEADASLKARGQVLRVGPKLSLGFPVAIGCDAPFRIVHPKRAKASPKSE